MDIARKGWWMTALLFAVASAAQDGKESAKRIDEAYPGLVPGALSQAVIKDLPDGMLLVSGAVRISAQDLRAEIDKVPADVQPQVRKNAPFFLDQVATRRLLLEAAKADAAEKKIDLTGKSESDVIQSYLDPVERAVKVGLEEVKAFYDSNASLCGGAPFEMIKVEIEQYVLQQKREEASTSYIKTLGRRREIAVSTSWLKEQVPLARDNAVDKSRGGGKVMLVNFGGASCCGPDKMLPVLEEIEEKYKDKLAVVYIQTREDPVLAARFGVRSVPTQILFDKTGKEIFRHAGLLSADEIGKELGKADIR